MGRLGFVLSLPSQLLAITSSVLFSLPFFVLPRTQEPPSDYRSGVFDDLVSGAGFVFFALLRRALPSLMGPGHVKIRDPART